jgi:predicted chitinase
MSDFKIIGNPDPVVGKEEFYSVNTFLPSVLPFQNSASNNSFEQPVKWEIYILENGRWRKTKENDKTGKRISYTFLQKSLERKGIRILARRGEDVARLNVTTHPAEKPKIESIELLDKNGQKPGKPLSYGQTLKARVHCLHMEKHKVSVTLWEDDAIGAGHNKANENNLIQTLSGVVANGKADVDFLMRPSFAKIAKQNGPEEGKIHEYYVTVDFNKDKIASNNVNVNDLEAPVAPFKGKVPVQQQAPAKPKASLPQPTQPKTKAPATGSSSAPKVKAEITRVHITNSAKQPIKGTHKEKEIIVWVDSQGLIGKEIRFKLYDEDYLSNDLLVDQKFKITGDIFPITVHLDRILRSKGGISGEGAEQELFADVEVIQTSIHSKSEVVDVDAKVFKPDPVEQTNKTAKIGDANDDKKDKGKGVCQKCIDPVTADQLKDIFPNADPTKLEKVASTYTKYMKDLGMDTCWNKAHFFAQAMVEGGKSLELKTGELMNFAVQALPDTFSAFSTTGKRYGPPNDLAFKYGRIDKNNIKTLQSNYNRPKLQYQSANKEMIANTAYSNRKELGNKGGSDGWNFRGRGLIQITGREIYTFCNSFIQKYEKIDILSNPHLVGERLDLAVFTSMIFFLWKKINIKANKTRDVKNDICPLVGNNVDIKDKNNKKITTNYDEKQKNFNDITSKKFNIDGCKWGTKVSKPKVIGKYSTYDNNYTADNKTAYINIIVPSDRKKEGLLVFFDDSGILFKCYALALGTGGEDRYTNGGYGNVPNGLWNAGLELKTANVGVSFGNHGVIRLSPKAGDALKASSRSGILIHCGHTIGDGKTGLTDNGALMVTHGCIRVYNADMPEITKHFSNCLSSNKKVFVYVEEVNPKNLNQLFTDYETIADPKDSNTNRKNKKNDAQ